MTKKPETPDPETKSEPTPHELYAAYIVKLLQNPRAKLAPLDSKRGLGLRDAAERARAKINHLIYGRLGSSAHSTISRGRKTK